MNLQAIYDILVVEKVRVVLKPVVKGKPFERMGHKALEPTSAEADMVVSCQKGKTAKAKPIL